GFNDSAALGNLDYPADLYDRFMCADWPLSPELSVGYSTLTKLARDESIRFISVVLNWLRVKVLIAVASFPESLATVGEWVRVRPSYVDKAAHKCRNRQAGRSD